MTTNEPLKVLEPYLRKEKYPYELPTIRGFALYLINGDPSRLIEEFRMRSCGQAANSQASYQEALRQLTSSPGILEGLDSQVPFPTFLSMENNQPQIVVEIIPVQVALERINSFS